MLTMGSDFQYENAHLWYKNLDKLIHYVSLVSIVGSLYEPEHATYAACHMYIHYDSSKTRLLWCFPSLVYS